MLYRCINADKTGRLELFKLYEIRGTYVGPLDLLYARGDGPEDGMAIYRFELVPGLDFLKFFEEL